MADMIIQFINALPDVVRFAFSDGTVAQLRDLAVETGRTFFEDNSFSK